MKIGIVGAAERAVVWERHLRPHRAVSEVIIAPNLRDLGTVDACFLLDESTQRIQTVLEAIRLGFHTFLISRIPTDRSQVEKVYHSAEEANVLLQFSHWPTIAPASQWMAQKIQKPSFIHVTKEINLTSYLELGSDFDYLWIDELAYCLKWMNATVHQVDAREVQLGSKALGIHLFIRFDSGATAMIFVLSASAQNRHRRVASNNHYLAECNVNEQSVRLGQLSEGGHVFFDRKKFEPSESAERAALQFIKAIQLNKPSAYNGYDALQLCNTIEKVRERLKRF